jgi:hypothetical protein
VQDCNCYTVPGYVYQVDRVEIKIDLRAGLELELGTVGDNSTTCFRRFC